MKRFLPTRATFSRKFSKASANKRDFTQSFTVFLEGTTLHGVRHIITAKVWWKILIWLLLVIACAIGLAWMLNEKFTGQNPVTIDIDVYYEPLMYFPAVVVCNANSFKISVATLPKWNMYDVINDVYNDSQLQRLPKGKYSDNLAKIDGISFLKASAHQLEDMLQYCRWPNGSECTENDFQMVLTDYGVCYKINYAKDEARQLNGTNPGSGYGLYMILNTEDYEAMPGPQNTVGMKVLVYNQSDLPLVAEHGFDVAPGFQTSVGLKYSETQKLTRGAGGQCGSVKMYFFPNDAYNRKLCTVDHKETTENYSNYLLRKIDQPTVE